MEADIGEPRTLCASAVPQPPVIWSHYKAPQWDK